MVKRNNAFRWVRWKSMEALKPGEDANFHREIGLCLLERSPV